jgi:hypothetical protein
VRYFWYIDWEFAHFDAARILEIMGLLYNVYYMFDYNCTIEQVLYDLSTHCFDHNCEPERLLQNEMANVFQVTGALNALAAIYYEPQPEPDQHEAFFDMYNEIGLAVGKLARYTLAFDPKAERDY